MEYSFKVKIFSFCIAGFLMFPATSQAFETQKARSHNVYEMPLTMVRLASNPDQSAGAENFINTVAKQGISFLEDPSLSEEQRKKAFGKLLVGSFDINTIGRFAMGRYWRSASSAQRKEYLDLFKKMVVNVYSQRFSDYDGQQLKVVGSRSQGDSDFVVETTVVSKEGPDVQVDWRVRYKNGQYKIVDVLVEGVSMALTHRSDFASVIQRGGGDVSILLAHLRE